MAVQGPWAFFNLAKPKLFNGGGLITPGSDTFKVALTTSSQSLTAAFAGTSTDARYSDLTAELATANGYTNGGLTLTSVTFTLSSATITWNCATMSWPITGGGITFKYAVLYDNTTTHKDLVAYTDFDTGGGSVSALSGTLSIPGPIATVS